MIRLFIHLTLILFLSSHGLSQNWEKRHKFAKTYFGTNNYCVFGLTEGIYLDSEGNLKSFTKNNFISPAINIGATHFWGYADFYVSINTVGLKFKEDEVQNSFRLGTFTGLRIYPWPSTERSIRPYAGYKFSPFRYRQEDTFGNRFSITKVKSIFDLGVGIQLPKFYFTLEYGYVVNPKFETYLSRDVTSNDQFPSHILQLGINYTIETTQSASTRINKKSNDIFSATNEMGLFLAGGPSSSFPLQSSNYITELYPYTDDKSFPIIFPDLAIGYHFLKLDLITAFSFRPISQKRSAYGFEQIIKRNSLNFETYKYLWDYHGFVPYIGGGIAYEKIRLMETENEDELTDLRYQKISPNIVFGWDIRPSMKGDWWILRTNLRYFPFLTIGHQNHSLSLQHLEFNFIQFVLYPQKLKKIKALSKYSI